MEERPWLRHYDPGVPQELHYPEVPLFGLLEGAARDHPAVTCTLFRGARISYQQMDQLTDRLAAALADLGVK